MVGVQARRETHGVSVVPGKTGNKRLERFPAKAGTGLNNSSNAPPYRQLQEEQQVLALDEALPIIDFALQQTQHP